MRNLLNAKIILTIILVIDISGLYGKAGVGLLLRENRRGDWCSGDPETDNADALDCVTKALKVLKKQMFTNPDDPHELAMIPKNEKKPDYYARKTCNLLNTISEECYTCLAGQAENLQEIKDKAIENFLEEAKRIPDFDAKKCPVVKDYYERHSSSGMQATTVFNSMTILGMILCLTL